MISGVSGSYVVIDMIELGIFKVCELQIYCYVFEI